MRVYKFLPANFALKSLYERRLKISTLSDLNDPFDFSPFATPNAGQRERMRFAINGMMANRGILCFSADWNDPVVWAHYADKHYGICLGFELPDIACKAVKYVAEKLPFPTQPTKQTAEDWLFVKFSNWQYEHEIRAAASLDQPEESLYYSDFNERLRLVEVILGTRCTQPKAAIERALSELRRKIIVRKARPDHEKFQIVEDTKFK